SLRLDDIKGATHNRPEIERVVHHLHPGRRIATCEGESGRGCGGQNRSQLWLQSLQLGRKLEGDSRLAHADGVQPGYSTPSQSLSDTGIVQSKTLTEFLAITAAAKHLDQITRDKDQQANRPKQIVNEADHLVADCGLQKQHFSRAVSPRPD